jgi:hypothetical protein
MSKNGVEAVKRYGIVPSGELARFVTVIPEDSYDGQPSRARRAGVRVADVAGAEDPDVHDTQARETAGVLAGARPSGNVKQVIAA